MNRQITEEEIANILMEALYKIPDYMSVQHNIIKPLNLNIDELHIRIVCRQLLLEGLIEECNSEKGILIRITQEGYKAIKLFDTYTIYKRETKKAALSEKKIIYLKEKNILLKNINLEIAIITFIAGILLSDPIKKLLKHWLICD